MMTAPAAGSQAAAESLGDTVGNFPSCSLEGAPKQRSQTRRRARSALPSARAVAANRPDVDTKPAVVCIMGITGLVAALLV